MLEIQQNPNIQKFLRPNQNKPSPKPVNIRAEAQSLTDSTYEELYPELSKS